MAWSSNQTGMPAVVPRKKWRPSQVNAPSPWRRLVQSGRLPRPPPQNNRLFPWDESNDNGAAEPQRQSGWIFHTQPRSHAEDQGLFLNALRPRRSEEHTSELQPLLPTPYAV